MSEADAMDIYYHGEEKESGKKVRKNHRYEGGTYVRQDTNIGGISISTICEPKQQQLPLVW